MAWARRSQRVSSRSRLMDSASAAREEAFEVGVAGRDGPEVLGPVQLPGRVLGVAVEPDGEVSAEVGGELVVVVPAVLAGLVGPPVGPDPAERLEDHGSVVGESADAERPTLRITHREAHWLDTPGVHDGALRRASRHPGSLAANDPVFAQSRDMLAARSRGNCSGRAKRSSWWSRCCRVRSTSRRAGAAGPPIRHVRLGRVGAADQQFVATGGEQPSPSPRALRFAVRSGARQGPRSVPVLSRIS